MASRVVMSSVVPTALRLGVATTRRTTTSKTSSARTKGSGGARVGVRVAAGHGHGHGHGHGSSVAPTKGFVEEMRQVAMRLHTREQAPREGEKPADAQRAEQRPVARWTPTPEGYLKFLVESLAVYEAMETIVNDEANAEVYGRFKNSGLERTGALKKDVEYLCQRFGLTAPNAEGPGKEYAVFLTELAKTAPPEFICHFYNVYFAHSAGGRMIGRKVSEMILDGKELEFYEWRERGGLDESLTRVRGLLNDTAEKWTREEKDRCLEETGKSFELSGQLLRLIA